MGSWPPSPFCPTLPYSLSPPPFHPCNPSPLLVLYPSTSSFSTILLSFSFLVLLLYSNLPSSYYFYPTLPTSSTLLVLNHSNPFFSASLPSISFFSILFFFLLSPTFSHPTLLFYPTPPSSTSSFVPTLYFPSPFHLLHLSCILPFYLLLLYHPNPPSFSLLSYRSSSSHLLLIYLPINSPLFLSIILCSFFLDA